MLGVHYKQHKWNKTRSAIFEKKKREERTVAMTSYVVLVRHDVAHHATVEKCNVMHFDWSTS